MNQSDNDIFTNVSTQEWSNVCKLISNSMPDIYDNRDRKLNDKNKLENYNENIKF